MRESEVDLTILNGYRCASEYVWLVLVISCEASHFTHRQRSGSGTDGLVGKTDG